MLNRSLLLVVVSLLFASPALAQFVPSNRLTDAAARLSRDAEDFANASYNNYSNSGRNGRNEIDAMMTAQQLGASARIFYRMVVDRRRNQELRDAYEAVRTLANSADRNNLDRNSWYSVQRSLVDVGRELNNYNSGRFSRSEESRGGKECRCRRSP